MRSSKCHFSLLGALTFTLKPRSYTSPPSAVSLITLVKTCACLNVHPTVVLSPPSRRFITAADSTGIWAYLNLTAVKPIIEKLAVSLKLDLRTWVCGAHGRSYLRTYTSYHVKLQEQLCARNSGLVSSIWLRSSHLRPYWFPATCDLAAGHIFFQGGQSIQNALLKVSYTLGMLAFFSSG